MSEVLDLNPGLEEDIEILTATPQNGLTVITEVEKNIALMRQNFLGLTIQDAHDKAGYERVRSARLTVKKARVEVDKARKYLNEDHQAAIDKNNSLAKAIKSELEPIEADLKEKEDWFEAEKDRLRREELRKNLLIRRRVEIILSYDTRFDGVSYKLGDFVIAHEDVARFDEEEFDAEVHRLEAKYKKIQAIKLEEETQARAERKGQEEEAAELRRQQQEVKAEREKLEQEKKELARQREVETPATPTMVIDINPLKIAPAIPLSDQPEVNESAPAAPVKPVPAPPKELPRSDISTLQSIHKALRSIREGFEFKTHSLAELKEELDNDLREWENKLEQAIRYEVNTL